MDRRPGRRATRTALTGTALILLTVAAHAAGGGDLPPMFGLLLVSAMAMALTFAVSDRRRSLPWLVGYMLAGQLFLHMLMTFAGGHAHGTPLLPDTGMLSGHALGGALAAMALAYADGLLDRWAAFLGQVLGTPVAEQPSPARPRQQLRAAARVVSVVLACLLHEVERRGPPALAAVTASA